MKPCSVITSSSERTVKNASRFVSHIYFLHLLRKTILRSDILLRNQKWTVGEAAFNITFYSHALLLVNFVFSVIISGHIGPYWTTTTVRNIVKSPWITRYTSTTVETTEDDVRRSHECMDRKYLQWELGNISDWRIRYVSSVSQPEVCLYIETQTHWNHLPADLDGWRRPSAVAVCSSPYNSYSNCIASTFGTGVSEIRFWSGRWCRQEDRKHLPVLSTPERRYLPECGAAIRGKWDQTAWAWLW